MVTWVFGYGSLIWKAGFHHDERLVGFIRGYRRVFYQDLVGVAYRISEQDEEIALEYLEVREKQYDLKVYLDFFTDADSTIPAVSGVMVYVASADKDLNRNYLGPASIEEMAMQIVNARGPSGPNRDYLFHLEAALIEFGCEDSHVRELAAAVRKIILGREVALSNGGLEHY